MFLKKAKNEWFSLDQIFNDNQVEKKAALGRRTWHLHIAFAVLQEKKYAKPAHERYLQVPATASREINAA